jgi:hypothetical protein
MVNDGAPIDITLGVKMDCTKRAVFRFIREEVETAEDGEVWGERVRYSIKEIWHVTETSIP